MKQRLSRILLLAFIALLAVLFVSYGLAQAHPPAQPPIPHSLDGHSDCVSCHATGASGAPKFPADHQGRTNDVCLGCHKQGDANSSQAGATPAAPAGAPGAPHIPHTLQGRDDCLGCHKTGAAGAPKIPSDHAGRTSDMCRGCHTPADAGQDQPQQPVPTLIAHPAASGSQSTCTTCHAGRGGQDAKIVEDWQASIHAQRGVTCVDCHGGDPNSSDTAMSAQAGFIGAPKKGDIQALCASCHSRVEMMRQYDLPTDQWSKYQQSIHGIRMALGDPNVPSCFTCHDGHGTKEVSDPNSQVYATNVPALCASCHSNSNLMRPYGIPTDQYDQYKTSVHGVALLEKQDTRAPNCATCHGTHGAAPPGISEVTNVCGSCHTATEDYYSQSRHAVDNADSPKCITCHGKHDVTPPSDEMFTATGTRTCTSCHQAASPQAEMVQSIGKSIADAAAANEQADAAIKRAADSALIVAPEELKLTAARTDLISARAAQHTLDLKTVKEKTDKSTAEAQLVTADAEKSIEGSVFRREFMGFGLAVMALAIGSLYVIRRELYKQLPKE